MGEPCTIYGSLVKYVDKLSYELGTVLSFSPFCRAG